MRSRASTVAAFAIRGYPRSLRFLGWAAALLVIGSGQARAQLSTLDVNLDGTAGAESSLKLEVLSNSPTNSLRLKIVNRAVGQTFSFNWYNSGPGGFLSSLIGETCSGTSIQWDWATTRVIYSYTGTTCDSSVCFYRTNPPPVVRLGPFGAPGRSLSTSGVTLSSASLTSSLLTFFAPPSLLTSCNQPKEITRVSGGVAQLTSGQFRYMSRVLNLTPNPVSYDLVSAPPCTCATPGCPECAFTGVVLPPGGAKEYCAVSPYPAKEESNGYILCGVGIPGGPDADPTAGTPAVRCSTGAPATRGPFNIFVPDSTKIIGTSPFLTPDRIVVTDPNGNGIPEPGETVSLRVFLANAGPVGVIGVTATLSSPPADLTDDGTANPVAVNITSASSVYPDIAGAPPTSAPPGDCDTPLATQVLTANTSSFTVSYPSNHPSSVGRLFNLHVAGAIPGKPPGSFQMDVPFVLTIGATCTPP